MNELARRFCVDFFNIKKVAIFHDSLFFCQHILFRRSLLHKNIIKKN